MLDLRSRDKHLYGSEDLPVDVDLGRATLTVNPTTQADVWLALEQNSPFPDETLSIGAIKAQYASGHIPIGLEGGASVSLTASFSAGGHSGIGIFSTAAEAVASLGLDPSVTPDLPATADHRFLLLSFDAKAQGSVSGAAPIGVLGSVTFGAKASGCTCFAVLYRFRKDMGARTVLEQAGACIKLPREVHTAADLPQGAWLIAEVDGSLGLSVGAKVGYDYTYAQDLPDQLQQLGLSKDLSVKVDAAATATVGYNVSGRYLVMLGRPSLVADEVVSLRIHKGNSYGYSFGLNLSVGVQMSEIRPEKSEGLVAASFGIFGPQIFTDVSKSIPTLDAWTTGDLGPNNAALTIKSAKDLLTNVTGVNVEDAMAGATSKLKNALSKWSALAPQGSSDLQTLAWKTLGDTTDKQLIVALLTDLQNENSFDKALSDGLQSLPGQTWLLAMANALGETSVLSLGSHRVDVKQIAGNALAVLSDDNQNILLKLYRYITDRFQLTTVITMATNPAQLDPWVQNRMAACFNQISLTSDDWKKIQTAIKALLSKFDDLYARTATALTKKCNFDFAASYENVADNATLLDLSFDLSKMGAALYQQVLNGDTSAIFRLPAPQAGFTLRNAVMSHGVHRTAKTSLTIPYLATATTDLNTSIAKLTFEQNGANLVGYVDATDQVRGDRYRSLLKLAMKLGVNGASLTSIDGCLAYELRAVAKNASKAAVNQATAPFVATYLGGKFGPHEYSDKLLTDFDRAVDLQTSELGDMVMSMQLAIDGDFLAAWVATGDRLKSMQMEASRVVQQHLRAYTHQLYFARQRSGVDSWATLPLLVWGAFPICTGVDWDPHTDTLSSTNTGKDFYLSDEDGADPLIKALINATSGEKAGPSGWGMLNAHVAAVYLEVQALGVENPIFFSSPPDKAAKQMLDYVFHTGFPEVRSLALAEAGVVRGVVKALKNMSDAASDISSWAPSALLEHLSEFGATLTSALNKHMTNLFAKDDLRLFGPMLLVELTKALAPVQSDINIKAMLELKSLKPQHTFDINTYVGGSEPAPDQIAVSQTVVQV